MRRKSLRLGVFRGVSRDELNEWKGLLTMNSNAPITDSAERGPDPKLDIEEIENLFNESVAFVDVESEIHSYGDARKILGNAPLIG